MKNDKSPGSDGYTTEVLKNLFVNLDSLMVRSINHGFCKGKMSVAQTQGIITCIPKEGKDKIFLKKMEAYYMIKYCIQNCIILYCKKSKNSAADT